MAKTELAEILNDRNTFTTTAMMILLDEYGTDFLYWDPVTVGLEIKRDFGVVPERYLMDKLQAGTVLLINDLFFKSFETFNTICNVLNIGVFDSDLLIPATLDDIMWSCTEARLVLGEDYTGEFSHDIARYAGKLLSVEGIHTPPAILSFAEYPEQELSSLADLKMEDEIMFKVFWDRQAEAKDESEKLLNQRMITLLEQLEAIPSGPDRKNLRNMIEKLKRAAS